MARAQEDRRDGLMAQGEGFSRSDPHRGAGWLAVLQFLSVPLDQRRRLMRSSAARHPAGDEFFLALYHDPELRNEALSLALERIRSGDLGFSSCLEHFPEDRRVRRVAVDALRRAKKGETAGIIRALGRLGGPGVLPELRRRFRRALRWKLSAAEDGLPCIVAGALLRLDPQAMDAARFLASALRHRSWRVRQWAAGALQKTLNPHAGTEAMVVLQAPVLHLLDRGDLESAFIMADAVWILAPERFRHQCLRLIAKGGKRSVLASQAAAELIRHDGPRQMTAILDWLRHRAPIDDRLMIAAMLGSGLPEREFSAMVKKGLAHSSPFVRLLAVDLMEARADHSALGMTRVVRAALATESDPELRFKLEGVLHE